MRYDESLKNAVSGLVVDREEKRVDALKRTQPLPIDLVPETRKSWGELATERLFRKVIGFPENQMIPL